MSEVHEMDVDTEEAKEGKEAKEAKRAEKNRIKSKKMIRTRYVWAVVMLIGFTLLLVLEPEMGHRGVRIGQVFGILAGGLMFFSGGVGVAVTTLFLRLESKPKDKAW